MFRDALAEIAGRCQGLEAMALVGPDGLPIEVLELEGVLDVEMLAAETVALAKAAHDNHDEFGGGGLSSLVIESGRHLLLLGAAAEEVFLVLILDREQAGREGAARAKFELRRSCLLLGPALLGDSAFTAASGG